MEPMYCVSVLLVVFLLCEKNINHQELLYGRKSIVTKV